MLIADLETAQHVSRRVTHLVVGAGSSGCALAARLSENTSHRVLLVESGKYYGPLTMYPEALRDAASNAFSWPGHPSSWTYTGQLTTSLTYPVTRGRVVGGSGAVNGAQFMRGRADEYDTWAALGNDLWSYEAVLPYFRALETDLNFGDSPLHGARGPIKVSRVELDDITPISRAFVGAALDAGHTWDPDMNDGGAGGIGLVPLSSVRGIRQNAGASYIEPIIERSNLFLLDETLVRKVRFDGTRAVGVVVSRHGQTAALSAEEVVLCAGGINSPQLLMLSGIGPADVLSGMSIPVVCDSPGVGSNLTDHPFIGVTYEVSLPPTERNRPVAEVNLNYPSGGTGSSEDMRIFPYVHSKKAMLLRPGGEGSIATRGLNVAMRPLRAARYLRGASREALYQDVKHRSHLALNCSLGVPHSRGQISLRSDDAAHTPIIKYCYLSEETDRRRIREAVRTAVSLLRHDEFRALEATLTSEVLAVIGDDAALDEWALRNIGTSYHTASTCKMGPDSDESAVVDQYCRVRGVDRLRVADLSILPTLTSRGPNATAIMLGERAAVLAGDCLPHTETSGRKRS